MSSIAPTLLALAVAAAEPGPALVVHAPGDATTEDRVAERLARALSNRMPALRVVVEGAAGADDLLVTVAPGDDAWSLTVRRADQVVLERALPIEQGPDAAFVVACALVVERFLQEIDWKGKPESIDPNAVAKAPPPPELPYLTLPEVPPPTIFSVGVGAAGALGMFPGQARIGAALDLTVRHDWLLVAVRAHWYAPTVHTFYSNLVDRTGAEGQIREMPVGLAAMGGACFFSQPSVCAGVELGWRGTWGWTSGPAVAVQRTAATHDFLGGLFGSIGLRLPYRLEARALLTAVGFAGGSAFVVEDGTSAIPSSAEIGLAISLSRQIP